MKILLANAPWRKDDRYGVRAGSRWPFTQKKMAYTPFPFYLAYAADLLEKNEFEVNLVDAIAERQTEKKFLKSVNNFRPELLLLETSTPSIFNDLAIAKKIKEETNAQVALCGPHATVFCEEILRKNAFIDFVLVGEYERTLLELAERLRDGGNLDVCGLAYRSGEIHANPRRALIDLDGLPWPARHFLPMHRYSDGFAGMPQSAQMLTSRGCPYGCIFCVYPQVMYGCSAYRVRNVKSVVDEMEFLLGEYNFRAVYFDDDIFMGKKRIIELCSEMKKRKIDTLWGAMSRADVLDREVLRTMADAGLYAIKYGIESGSQKILNACGKKLSLERAREAVKMTKELGVKVHLTFMLGLPGETKESIRETMAFASEADADSIQFSIATPFPGTEFFRLAEEGGSLLTRDWSRYDGACSAVVRTEELSGKEVEEAYRESFEGEEGL